MPKVKVAYVCVHNSCRSQIAEALTNHYFSKDLKAYSGGTQLKNEINSDAVFILKDKFAIDIAGKQIPKSVYTLPSIDIVITMGCEVDCPYLPCQFREDWGLDDPTGKGLLAMEETANTIKEKIEKLVTRIKKKEIIIK